MSFSFSDEQKMIRDSAFTLLAEQSTSAAVRAAMDSDSGVDTALWQTISREMQWCAITVPEHCGGLGLGQVELAIVHEAVGRHVACVPLHATASLAASALLLAGSAEQQARYLAPLASGALSAALAYSRDPRHGARFTQADDGYRLDGQFPLVPHAHVADLLLIVAHGTDGPALFALPAQQPGLQVARCPTLDPTRAQGELTLNAVMVPMAARLAGGNAKTLGTVLSLGAISLAAEQLGVAEAALALAVAYTGEREQFGRSIASFQAIKHRAADMMLKCELARSAVYYAACIADATLEGAKVDVSLADAASLAKTYACDAAYFVSGSAIQLLGGVGFTWEYDAHLYFKRAQSASALLGSPAQHRARIAQRLLDDEEAVA